MSLNHDLLNNIPRKEVSKASFRLLTRLQDASPEIQVAAACVLFLLLSERHGQDPAEVFRMATNALAFDQKPDSEQHFAAIREYLQHEV